MTIRAVLFDIDGTLVDSNDHHVTAWDEAFRAAGHVFDRQTIHDQVGKGSDNLIPSLLPDSGDAERERISKIHKHIYLDRCLQKVRPFKRAHDLLARVHASGRKVVLATSASKPELDHYIDLLDARALLCAATSADDVEHTKPDPDIFASALAKIAPIQAHEAIVVGDTPYDIAAAAKCGIPAIGLRSGKFRDDQLRETEPIALYDDVAALLADFDRSPLA